MNNLFIISNLIFLFTFSTSVSSEFIPPSNQVCLGDSITFNCVLIGDFTTVQTFLINSTSINMNQINNLPDFSGIDLTRLNATVDNVYNQNTFAYTALRANITLVNITKEDNNTLIGCKATDAATGTVEESDTLILSSPPSQPIIQLTPINSNCSVRLEWSYPVQSTLHITQQITDSVTNDMLTVQGQNYLSDFLTAGENISYLLSAVNCLGDSVTVVSEVFSPLSQPQSYTCTADYGTENRMLVLEIVNYTSEYAIVTGFIITDDTDNSMILSDNFSVDRPFYYSYSQVMLPVDYTRNYTVLFTSVLRDCTGSMSTTCQVKLNIIALVTPTPSPTTTANMTTSSMSATTTPTPTIPPYTIYIVIAIILFLFLLFLSCVIMLLACILGRGKLSRSKYVPKDARRFPNPASTPDKTPESGQDGEELHYITPVFSTNSAKPKSPISKTLYSDISEMPVASESLSSL